MRLTVTYNVLHNDFKLAQYGLMPWLSPGKGGLGSLVPRLSQSGTQIYPHLMFMFWQLEKWTQLQLNSCMIVAGITFCTSCPDPSLMQPGLIPSSPAQSGSGVQAVLRKRELRPLILSLDNM